MGCAILTTRGTDANAVISFQRQANNAVAAVNITASHSRPNCGFQVRDENGGTVVRWNQTDRGADPAGDEGAIGACRWTGAGIGSRSLISAQTGYLARIWLGIDVEPIKKPLKIVVDNMWGTAPAG